jgi:hypothetical protein
MTAHLNRRQRLGGLEQFDTYRRILDAELSVDPSPQMFALVRSIGRAPRAGNLPLDPTG